MKIEKKQFQIYFDEKFLRNKGFALSIAILFFFILLFFMPFWGTVVVDNLNTSKGNVVELRKFHIGKPFTSGKNLQRVLLLPQGTAKLLLPTGWFGKRDYYIKVSGLPAISIPVNGFRRTKLLVPDTFEEQPIILAHPVAKLTSVLGRGEFMLEVLVDGRQEGKLDVYHGQAIWIGEGEDITVPKNLIEQWQFDLVSQGINSRAVSQWANPIAVTPKLILTKGMSIIVNLRRRDDMKIVFSGRHEISHSGKARQFPEEVIIHAN